MNSTENEKAERAIMSVPWFAVYMDFAEGVLGYETFLTAVITRNLSGKGEAHLLFDTQGRKRYR